MNDLVLYFSLKYDGKFFDIYDAIKNKEPVDNELFAELKKEIKHDYVTIFDSKYPEYLKKTNCPPFVLFYEGNIELIDSDLPVTDFRLKDGVRVISTVCPESNRDRMILDYVAGAENQSSLDQIKEHIIEKDVPLKKQNKKRNMER